MTPYTPQTRYTDAPIASRHASAGRSRTMSNPDRSSSRNPARCRGASIARNRSGRMVSDADDVGDRVDEEGRAQPPPGDGARREQRSEGDRGLVRGADRARWPAGARRRVRGAGASAANAGSLKRRAQPMPAPSTTSIQYEPANDSATATAAAAASATMITVPRAEAVDGQAAERPEHRGRQRPGKRQQRDLRRPRVEPVARVSPQRDERAPAPDRVDRLAGNEERETAIAQQGHSRPTYRRTRFEPANYAAECCSRHRKRWCTRAWTISPGCG